jgi:acyl carrier protein
LARAASNRDIVARNPLRFLRSGSASLPPQVITDLEAVFNAPLIESYGLTEATKSTINPMPPLPRKLGSAGLAAGSEVGIMDEAGKLLPAGIVGEVVIRGDNVTPGYEDDPEANAQAFTNGWLRSGDLGYLDADDYLFITGRLKEQINRAGQKVSPREVEEVLMDHPAVARVVTFAVPDDQLGEDVAAAVVLREGASATSRELREFAAVQLADYKVPRRIVFVDEIPLGMTGKIERMTMAAKLGLTSSTQTRIKSAFAAPRTPIESRLAEIWAQVLGLDRVGIHDHFLDLGGDSMLATQVFARVREEFGVEMTMIAFFEMPTIALQAKNIEKAQCQTDEIMRALSEIENLSDAEAQQLLAQKAQ